ncbi:hypothetical protein LJR175_008404 [Variovorax sp. LjRoot175]|uniref:DUF6884 domain-containing protein n=1 Tax=Variovorax sp. LjRoot175 TaxID=3342276 RepID=UPI003ECE6DB3
MERPLILMPCSGTKLDYPAPAQDFYQGVMWQSLRANVDPDRMPHIVVLSALYGFVEGAAVIEPYDRKLTEARARELYCELDQFVNGIPWPKHATRILIAGGGHYRHMMRAMVGALIHNGKLARHLQISEVSGGIGTQRSQLGQFARDPSSIPSPYAGYHQNGTPCLREAWGLRVGDRVRTSGRYVGKAGPKFARVEEIFDGPGGPTASVEFEDDRPPLANGKSRPAQAYRAAWIGVENLERAGCVQSAVAESEHYLDPDEIWQPNPGLRQMTGGGDAPLDLLTEEEGESESLAPRS